MKHKYNLGDKVFYLYDGKIASDEITGILVGKKIAVYSFSFPDKTYLTASDYTWKQEKELFLTREELIKSL